jgi:hypothetical protein
MILNHFQNCCNGFSSRPWQNRDKTRGWPAAVTKHQSRNISELRPESSEDRPVKIELVWGEARVVVWLKRGNETHQSTTDPDSRLAQKSGGHEAKLAYCGNVIIENR